MRALKSRYDFHSVFGGPHPTFFPEIIDEESVDAVCLGEADETFPDYLFTGFCCWLILMFGN